MQTKTKNQINIEELWNQYCKDYSTYTYDHTTARVSQVTTSSSTPTTTTTYISKFYSLTSTQTTSTTTNATSTTYVYMGDTLVSTIDQPLINGTATGTAIISYIHPNHLQSTNIVTDQNKNIVQSLDYLPYGAPRINTKTTSIDSARKYIGQFADGTGLDYLNARYYEGSRGQFLSQDPTFLAIGNQSQLQQLTKQNQQQFLMNPQQLNSYSYAQNNPIIKKDPDGNFAFAIPAYYAAVTAPEWVPAVLTGIGLAATYITADIALRNNGNGWGTRWGGTVPTLDPAKMGFGPPPMGPEDWQPNFNNRPPWMKIVGIGSIISMGVSEFAQPIWDRFQSFANSGTQAQQILNSQFNSSSVQTRVQATQAYNAATGASTPQQQLWVTPNGTVINWNGGVIAPAPSNSSSNK